MWSIHPKVNSIFADAYMESLPTELLPRLLSDPAAVRALACCCRDLSARVSRATFWRSGRVVGSDYYALEYDYSEIDLFIFRWLTTSADTYTHANEYAAVIIRHEPCFKILATSSRSWEFLLPAPRGAFKYIREKCYTGSGWSKNSKVDLIVAADNDWAAGCRDAVLISRQPICNSNYIMFGGARTINALAAAVGQNCVVYARV